MGWKTRTGVLAGSAAAGVGLAVTARRRSEGRLRQLWTELTLEGDGQRFDPAQVQDVPEPARRFLLRAIQPGAALARSVELQMRGDIRLSPERAPLPFRARQILAPPEGFVWRARARGGAVRIFGFDRYAHDEGEMRWRLYDMLPVVRSRGEDVTRSAAGRLAMEAVLMPAALLPGRGATWESVDDVRARFSLTVGSETVVSTVEVDREGRPLGIRAMRWSERAGPGYEMFGVELSGERLQDGYRIPSEVTAVWRPGLDGEFRFYRATLERATFR